MSKESKLKTCPFCGVQAQIIQRKNKFWHIGCNVDMSCPAWACMDKNCDCKDGYALKKDAVKYWNIRWQAGVHDVEEFYKD